MELTLNELKIIRNALNKKFRDVCILSPEYDDIKHSLQKVKKEIERIEKDSKQKTFEDIVRSINAVCSLEYSYGSESFIKIEVYYALLKPGELEALLSFKDKNQNCVITFK